jgi:hypothetical protein
MKVRHLTVTVKYMVGYGDVTMPKNVHQELEKASEKCEAIDMHSSKYPNAAEWLNNNVREKDCMEWEADVMMEEK